MNELTTEELESEDRGQNELNHITKAFAEYLDRRLPKAFDIKKLVL